MRARGGALNFNSNGLDVNNYNDDNRYNNVAASRSLPLPNFCLPFLSLPGTFYPAAEHPADFIELLL